MPGLFITFEGVDKAGKSTQIKKLAQRLQDLGRNVLCTREPGGTPLCEELRDLVMKKRQETISDETELLLFAASRAQLLRERIWPALEEGTIVLSDRFADSTTAYQGYARGMNLDFIRKLNDFALGNRWPDLTILLDLTVEESFARLDNVLKTTAADSDRFEIEGRKFHEKVRNGFLAIAKENPQRFAVISAAQPVEDIAEQIWKVVNKRLCESVNIFETDYWRSVTPGNLLQGYRLKHELTQKQLSALCGIHHVVLSAYETGKRKLSKRAAAKIAKALNEPEDIFFKGIVNP